MSHELASRLALMFDESGGLRVAKTKSVLKNKLKVEVPRRHTQIDALFLDGCVVLWGHHEQPLELYKNFSTTSVVIFKTIWSLVMSIWCLTDTWKEASRSQPEMSETKEQVECTLYDLQPDLLLKR